MDPTSEVTGPVADRAGHSLAGTQVSAPLRLDRQLGLVAATATNLVTMIGAGPFVTIPLLLGTLRGPQAMLGWIIGAIIALCDGLVWAELGAAFPHSGGGYEYVLESFDARSLGKLMSFMLLWQTVIITPLLIAVGAVGFSGYAAYLYPTITHTESIALAIGVCIVATLLIYRRIGSVARWNVTGTLLVTAVALWIVGDGVLNFHPANFVVPRGAFELTSDFWAGLGGATLFALFDYIGYQTIAYVGGEVLKPQATIPRAILLSIVAACTLYLTMNLSIVAVIPWQEAMHSSYLVSDFIARLHGARIAQLVTLMILAIMLCGVCSAMLGVSRIPYAAARHGDFFAVFARLHPTRRFPHIAVLFIGFASAVSCLFTLEELIRAGTVIFVLVQSLPVVIAVAALRARRPDVQRPFQMWWYPLPWVIAFSGWIYILVCSGLTYILIGLAVTLIGAAAYLWRAKRKSEWPWPVLTAAR